MSSPTRAAAFAVLRWSGLPLIVRWGLKRRAVTIVGYHDIAPDVLDLQLATLGSHYEFVTMRQFIDAHHAGAMDRLPDRALVVTVDDGLAGQAALVPVFEKHGVVPTIYVATGIVGTNRTFWWLVPQDPAEVERLKWLPDDLRLARLAELGFTETREYAKRTALSAAEIENLKGLVDFQPHTVFHPILTECSDERAATEIGECGPQLNERFGIDAWGFAYPNGACGEREIGLARDAGFEYGVTTELGLNDARTDPMRLRRIFIDDEAGPAEALVQASGVSGWLKRVVRRSELG